MQNIVFVEDNEDDLFLFDKAVNEINHRFNVYYGRCAFDLFYILERKVFPDVIFLDIMLPGQSGIDCLRILRSLSKYNAIPIIIYTAFGTEKYIEECYSTKANYFIVKPDSFEKLTSSLKTTLTKNWDEEKFPAKEAFVCKVLD